MVDTATVHTAEQILAQLFIAFGQGAGTMIVSLEAIEAATREYKPAIEKSAHKWNEIVLATLEYARAVGRIAAFQAIQGGRNVISEGDWRAAADQVYEQANKVKTPYLFCPICMGAPFPGSVGV